MSEQSAIARFVAAERPRVEAALEQFLPPESVAPERLHAAMRYAVFGGGKRLRPICVLLGATAVGGDPDRALPAACAVELLHTYSLVHDDLPCMDDDDLRRGRPTVHKVWDEAMAVLAGDGLLTLAFEVVAEHLPATVAGHVAAALARGAGSLGMVGGQVGDLEAERQVLGEEAVLTIDARKTAALFAASFEMGGICGGGEDAQIGILGRLGRDLGIAFQIVDDLLDLHATPEQMGKATGKDAARGKATLPALLGEQAAAERARALSRGACDLSRKLPAAELIVDLAGFMLQRSH